MSKLVLNNGKGNLPITLCGKEHEMDKQNIHSIRAAQMIALIGFLLIIIFI